MKVPLRIAGSGPELTRLQRLGAGDVEFLGWKSNEEIRQLYREATAVLLPGREDFGMVPVEAQACGTPVVALDEGGARETVVDGAHGCARARAIGRCVRGCAALRAGPRGRSATSCVRTRSASPENGS